MATHQKPKIERAVMFEPAFRVLRLLSIPAILAALLRPVLQRGGVVIWQEGQPPARD